MANNLDKLLKNERRQLEVELEDLCQQIKRDKARQLEVEQRLKHVRALLGDSEPEEMEVGEPTSSSQHLRSGTSKSVCDIAADILTERNKQPMYYKELAKEIISRGGILTGRTPEATLVSRMIRDPRFVRPTAKGYYALRGDYPTARNVGTRTARRHKSNQRDKERHIQNE